MRALFAVFLSILSISLAARRPDFAYPKTVERQAQEELRSALSRNDGPSTLRALINLSLAQSLLSPDNLEPVEQMLSAQATKVRQPLTANVIRLLCSDVTGNYALADSLMRSPASASLLRQAPLHDWRSVISGNSAFFPSLYDFAAVIAARNPALSDSIAAAMATANAENGQNILPRLYWLMLSADFDQLQRLNTQLDHLPEAAFALTALAQQAYTVEQRREAYALCRRWLDKFGSSPYRADVEAAIAYLTRPSLTIQGENLAAKGKVYRLKVKAICLNEASISHTNIKQPGAHTARTQLAFSGQGVFEADTVIEYSLSDYGVYRFVPIFKGQTDLRESDCLEVTVTDLLLLRTSFGSQSKVQALDALNGAPLHDVKLVRQNSRVSAVRGADRYSPSIWDGKNNDESKEVYHHANIFTSRGIYHPGDTLQFAATLIATSGGRSQLEVGKQITMRLLNANWTQIDSISAVSDEFGRISGAFILPKEGLTGNFTLQINRYASQSVTVADYVAPTFEVTASGVRISPSEVRITGSAMAYNGFPIAQAAVKISLRQLPHWGWRGNFTSRGPQVASIEVTTDSKGLFEAIVPCNDNCNLIAEAQVTSPVGETHSASSFMAARPYSIEADIPAYIVPGQALNVQVLNAEGHPESIPLVWSLTALAPDSTRITPDSLWSNVPSGVYSLTISPAEQLFAFPRTFSKVTVYRPSDKMPPEPSPLFVPVTKAQPGDRLLVGTSYANSHVLMTLWDNDKILQQQWLTPSVGNFFLPIELPQGVDQATLTLSTLHNFHDSSHDIQVARPQLPSSLQIEVSSMRQRMEPGDTERWTLRVVNNLRQPSTAALVLSVYAKALDAIQPFGWHFNRYNFGGNRFYADYRTAWERKCSTGQYVNFNSLTITPPAFDTYDLSWPQSRLFIRDLGAAAPMIRGTGAKYAMTNDAAANAAAADVAPENALADGGSISAPTNDTYRLPEVPQALWCPALVTNQQGEVSLEFTAPNAVTTWRLLACAYNQELLSGGLSSEVIVSKPVMVSSRVPRIITCGDSIVVSALVMNATSETQSIQASVEMFDPLTQQIMAEQLTHLDLPADSSAVVSMPLIAPNRTMLGVRIKARAGHFTDGEESIVAILPAQVTMGQAQPFFAPADSTEVKLQVPDNSVVTITPNAIWEVLTALPGLQANVSPSAPSLATALFSAATARGLVRSYPAIASALHAWQHSDSTLLSALQQNPDLKLTLLDNTPWPGAAQSDTERKQRLLLLLDKQQVDKAIAEAIQGLAKLVRTGGLTWTPDGDEPSYWVTSQVLKTMAQLHQLGYLPDNARLRQIIIEALRYADGEMGRTVVKQKRFYDVDFTSWRKQLEIFLPMTPSARKVVTNTVQHLAANWRDLSLEQKAEAALILHANRYPTTARSIVESLREFEAWTQIGPSAPVLQAFAAVEPHSGEVDLIRQYFIECKNAMNMGSSQSSAALITALLSCGSNWFVPSANQWHISLNGTPVAPSSDALFGSLRLTIPQGGVLTINKDNFPTWGGIYSTSTDSVSAIAPSTSGDLSITRRIEGSLQPGSRVKVIAEIKAARPIDYCVVSLPSCAPFEAVEQLPGRIWLSGTWAYREPSATATTYFINRLPRGTVTITEECYITAPGLFSLPPAQVQSQYSPALRANSASSILRVK